MANFRPRELWLAADSQSVDLTKLLQEAKALDVTVVPHKAGDEFAFGGATIRVLAPRRIQARGCYGQTMTPW
jgi:competence protein ComEC